MEEQGGLYYVAIRSGFELGLRSRISIHKFSRLGTFRLEQISKLV